MAAEFFWGRHSENADPAEAVDDLPGDISLPIDLCRVEVAIESLTQLR